MTLVLTATIGCGQQPNDAKPAPAQNGKTKQVRPATGDTAKPAIDWDTVDKEYYGATKERLGKELGKPDFTSVKWWYYDDRPGKAGRVDASFYFDRNGNVNHSAVQKARKDPIRLND